MPSLILRSSIPAWLLFALIAGPVAPSIAGSEVEGDSAERVRVRASERYGAGGFHRLMLGAGYRDLWEQEIDLPVLDLAREGGGLTPTGRFGGQQTAVLAFEGADGGSYTFRGTDKDPSAVLPEVLRDTVVEKLVQDQMALQHPGGPPSAEVLTEAAGVLTIHERMVVLPDDPALGEYREEFAGMIGTFYTYPTPAKADVPGFHGATEIIEYKDLYARLERNNEDRVDVRAFLRARLMDIFIGDFDRHRKQWRWARFPGDDLWKPIPEDRDQAFVRYDGVVSFIMGLYIPILQNYGDDYPGIKGLTLHGWEQDRWLLPHLSWSDWEEVVRDLQSRLSDDVIDRAIAALPAEYAEIEGERMRRDIRGRRDRLPEGARAFYEHLAAQVDIQASDATEHVRVDVRDEDGLYVEVRDASGEGEGKPERIVFARIFDPDETRDIRVYLRGGDDRVTVNGDLACIRLRVITGPGLYGESSDSDDAGSSDGYGGKVIDDRLGGHTRIYDEGHHAEVLPGPGTHVDRRPYVPPPSDPGFVDVSDIPPRDWGSDTIPIPLFDYLPDMGFFVGAAVAHTRYGFRTDPWKSKHSTSFGWAFEANAPKARYLGRFRPENSDWVGNVGIEYSGIDVLGFYGYGNDTSDNGSDSSFRVKHQLYRMEPTLSHYSFEERLRVTGGPVVELHRTKDGERLIDVENPYGNHNFGLVGLMMNVRFDDRRSLKSDTPQLELPFNENPAAGYPTSGFVVDLTGEYRPPLIGVVESYGWIDASIAGFVSFGARARATLSARVGGRETFGKTPFFDGATAGGGHFFSGTPVNRGFRSQRFLGDSSLYGNLDLRLFIGRFNIVVPTDVGVHGFFDVGRVFLDGESSDDWHPSGGGGIWFAPLVRTNTLSLSLAGGPENTLVYFRFGFFY